MPKQAVNIAKITAPQADEGVLHRDRLFSKLDRARKKAIIWVAGPAGCGKTTLVSSYIQARDLPCLWYKIDGGDHDLATFFHYLGLAAKKAVPRRRKPLPHLTPEYFMGIPTFSRNFFQELFSRLKPPILLVFDNYQEVGEDAPLHDSIIQGLSRIPDGMTCVILSRTNPLSPYMRLKTNRRLAVLYWQDLRFTVDEFREIATAHPDREPSAEVVSRLHAKTGGWVAGFHLMLESGDDVAKPRDADPHSYDEIFRYFAGELFERLPEKNRSFLLRTSYLPSMNSSMAEAISGVPDAAAILSSLYRDNFFISRSLHPWALYQYHQLFQEFLQKQAAERLPQAERKALQRQTAYLLIKEDLYDEAADLLRRAEDVEGLIGLIMAQGESLLSQGRNKILLSWLTSLPQDVLADNPWLQFWQGASLMAFNPREATPSFERAFNLFRAAQESGPGVLLAYAGILESIYYSFDDFHALRRWLALLPELLTPDSPLLPGDMGAYIVSSIYSALLFVLHPDAAKWEKLAFAAVENTGNISRKMVILFNKIGRFSKIEELDRIPRASLAKDGPPFAKLTGMMADLLHTFLTNRGKPGAMEEIVLRASQIAEQSGVHTWDSWLFGFTALALILQGRLPEAQKYYTRLESMTSRLGRWDLSFFYYLQGHLALKQGKHSKAAASIDTALKLTMEAGDIRSLVQICLLKAELLFRQGFFNEAFANLDEALENSEKHGLRVLLPQCFLLKGDFHYRMGHDGQGAAVVRKAMTMGREIGMMSFSFVETDHLAFCCTKALEHGIEKEYALELIRANNLIIPTSCYIEEWPWPLKIYTLGRFEVVREGRPLRSVGKVQQKPLELLRAQLAFGGRQVSEATIAEALWPDADGDMQHQALNTTMHRLRKLLGFKEAIDFIDGKISLNNRYCWVDTWAFERLCNQSEKAWKENSPKEGALLSEKALALYQDGFLAKETTESYSISLREKLRGRFFHCILHLGEHYENQGRFREAARHYEHGLAVDPLMEELYQKLMCCLQKQGKTAEVAVLYKRCRNTLEKVLGISPSEKTEAIYRGLSKK